MPRPTKKRIMPSAPVGRLLTAAGAKRAGADAIDALAEVLEDYAKEIGTRAVEISKHAGRRTVMDEDIKLAVKK